MPHVEFEATASNPDGTGIYIMPVKDGRFTSTPYRGEDPPQADIVAAIVEQLLQELIIDNQGLNKPNLRSRVLTGIDITPDIKGLYDIASLKVPTGGRRLCKGESVNTTVTLPITTIRRRRAPWQFRI